MKIVEHFYSIQGEGTNAGKAAYFIRLFGCNLKCDFGGGLVCDDTAHTDSSLLEELSVDTLVDIVIEARARLVVITGGEASLHNVNPLIEALQVKNIRVAVESNGTNIDNISSADHIVYAPKDMFDKSAPVLKSGFHELRVLANAEHPVDVNRWATVKNKFVSPINYEHDINMESLKYCIDFVKENPSWTLSMQTHKIMKVR